jgi:hypothetical protein
VGININFFLSSKAIKMKAIVNSIFKTFVISLMLIANTSFSYAQTASILPPAKTQLFDNNGNPLVSGKVDYFVPGTTTRKTTWQDSGQTIPNANPVILDGAGRALMLGNGSYRQVVRDRLNNVIWDQVTSSTGSGGGGGGSATVGDGQAVGTMQVWMGFTAPAAYAFAFGQEFTRAGFPELFSALTSNQTVSCTSGSSTLTSVGNTEQLAIGSAIESTCLNAGAVIVSKTISTIIASTNAIISTTSTARFFPYGRGDGSLTFNVPDMRGRVPAGRDNMGGVAANRLTASTNGFGLDANGIGVAGGSQSQIVTQLKLPNITPTFTGTTQNWGSSTADYRAGGNSGSFLKDGATTGFDAYTAGGGPIQKNVSTSVTPSGTITSINGDVTQEALPTVQPTMISNWVIKVSPDTNPNSFFGVASIGGMQGVLTCGPGINCSGNQISATLVGSVSCGDLTNGGTACQANTGAAGHAVPFLDGTNVFSGTSNTFTNGVTVGNSAAAILANPAATSGPAVDVTIQGLPLKASIDANNDFMLLWDSVSGAFRKVTPGQIGSVGVAGVTSYNGIVGIVAANVSDKTVYVSTLGNDARNGLSPETAKLTLQAAIQAASSGGVVHAGAGNFNLTSTLVMYPGVRVECEQGTSITQSNGANLSPMIDWTTNLSNGSGFKGCSIDGGSANNALSATFVTLQIGPANDVILENNAISNCTGVCVHVGSGIRPRISNNKFDYAFFIGVSFATGIPQTPTFGYITNNIFINVSGHAIDITNSDRNYISGNNLRGELVSGITVNTNGTSITWVSGPTFIGILPGNFITVATGQEYFILSVNSPTSMTISTSAGTNSNLLAVAGSGDMIGINASSVNTVIGNQLTNGGAGGIVISNFAGSETAAYNIASDNSLLNFGQSCVSVQGANNGSLVLNTKINNNFLNNCTKGGAAVLAQWAIAIFNFAGNTTTGTQITNNFIVDDQSPTNTNYGVGISGGSAGSVLAVNNTFVGAANLGIFGAISSINLSGGWGSTASTSGITSFGGKFRFIVTSNGTGQSNTPTITINTIATALDNPPGIVCISAGGTGAPAFILGEFNSSLGQQTLIFNGIPVAGSTYLISCS